MLLQTCYRSLENGVTERASNGPVAQLNRAFDYGSKGYRFESYRGHFFIKCLRGYSLIIDFRFVQYLDKIARQMGL